MSSDEKFEEMIIAGWEVLARDFNEIAIGNWRRQACKFLNEMLGPDHLYTSNLVDKAPKEGAMRDLYGIGLLCAAKESLFQGS